MEEDIGFASIHPSFFIYFLFDPSIHHGGRPQDAALTLRLILSHLDGGSQHSYSQRRESLNHTTKGVKAIY